jgi:uncharacterized protein YcbK (DUF882 family)
VTVEVAHKKALSSRSARAVSCSSVAALLLFFGCESLQNAVADGETRTISFHHIHTKEDLTVTFKRNGRYDENALKQINQLMRDWRDDNSVKMDPHVIDLLWEVHREVGAKEPIWVVGGHRSPTTNAELRRRSSGVAKFSQHMNGKAVDFYIPGIPLERIREAGLRAQRGGVGIYPSSGFVHMDTGSVRHWPRMPEEQLARVMAKGQLASRNASDGGRTVAVAQTGTLPAPSFLAKLFGGGNDAEAQPQATTAAATTGAATRTPAMEKTTDRVASKPVDRFVPVPLSRPTRTESFQVTAAESKPTVKPATFQLASAETISVPAPITAEGAKLSKSAPGGAAAGERSAAAESANDIINERGFWQGLPSLEPAEAKVGTARTAAPARRAATSSGADQPMTGSVAPWPLGERKDQESLPNALAYAAQPNPAPAARPLPMGSGTTRSPPAAAGETTIAVKRSDDRPTTTLAKSRGLIRAGDQFNDPWMRAMIVSPSTQEFMKVTLFGAQDFRILKPHLHKPAAVVMMTFMEDPHLGMSSETFGGSAIVFISTVTFARPRTAAVR